MLRWIQVIIQLAVATAKKGKQTVLIDNGMIIFIFYVKNEKPLGTLSRYGKNKFKAKLMIKVGNKNGTIII